MAYAVIAFLDTDCVDWVPMKWITNATGADPEDIVTLVENHTSVRVFWPTSSNPYNVSKARNRCSDREMNWPSFMCRILGTASEYTCHN